MVGCPLHVQAVDLEREKRAWSQQTCGAAEIMAAEVGGEGAACVS